MTFARSIPWKDVREYSAKHCLDPWRLGERLRQEQAASADDKLKARDEISSELERMSMLSEDIGKRLKAQELASTVIAEKVIQILRGVI